MISENIKSSNGNLFYSMAATSSKYSYLLTESNGEYVVGKLKQALRPATAIYERVKNDLGTMIKIILMHYKRGVENPRLRRTFVRASHMVPYCYGYFTLKMKIWVERLVSDFFAERDIYLLADVISKFSTLLMRCLAICFKYNKIKGIY